MMRAPFRTDVVIFELTWYASITPAKRKQDDSLKRKQMSKLHRKRFRLWRQISM
jgi:hypothetical protein